MPTTIVAATCPAPTCNWSPYDVEAAVAELQTYAAHFAPGFARPEQACWMARYRHGLVSDHPRTSIEPLALALGCTRRAMQAFIRASPWPTAPVLDTHPQLVAQTLGAADGVVLVDESGLPKQGPHSAGVAPQ